MIERNRVEGKVFTSRRVKFQVGAWAFSLLLVAASFVGCGSDGGDPVAGGGVGDALVAGQDALGGGEADVAADDVVAHGPDIVEGDASSQPDDVAVGSDVSEQAPSGGVIVWQAESDYLDRANVSAGFRWGVAPVETGDRIGDCVVGYADPEAETPPTPSLDAGTIVVSGTIPEATLTYGPALTGGCSLYTASLPDTNESLHPAQGVTVTATAAGGEDLPGFTLSETTPTPVTISEPSGGMFGSISATEALTVAWNAADADEVVVTVSLLDHGFDPVEGETLLCTVAGDMGAFEVPAEAMARLPVDAGAYALVTVTRVRKESVSLLGGEVSLGVTASSGVVAGID